ncbi:hypothetical protein Tco_1430881, partial [Tanacetum coccineum]
MHTVSRDGVTGIKRRRHDLYGDSVRNLETASGRGRLKEDLESSTWRRRQNFKATPSDPISSSHLSSPLYQVQEKNIRMEDSPEDNLENNRKQNKSRVGWKRISVVKTFMEACIHAIALDGREGVSLKYGAWLSLKNKTGNIYDESTNMFNLTDEELELEILKNKLVKPLKSTTLYFPELCAQLFDGTMATERIIDPEQSPKPKPPTLEDCQNKLKTIRWAEDDPLYE